MDVGLLEFGEILLSSSQRRLEVVSQNVANTGTPGYKRSSTFQIEIGRAAPNDNAMQTASVLSPGALRLTGRDLDLALSSEGFFLVRGESGAYLTRSGEFERSADGRLISAQGHALQDASGADLIIGDGTIEILPDGVILDDRQPTGRIGIFSLDPKRSTPIGGTLFSVETAHLTETASPIVRQGMLETANVELAGEMVDMMSALRMAEMGARVIQAYDTLLDQCITSFGQRR